MEYHHGMMDMLEVAHRAYHLGLVPGTSGNISVRAGAEGGVRMMISASGVSLGDIESGDLLAHPNEDNGGKSPSSEVPLHRALYGGVADADAILHYHGAWTTLAGEMARGDTWVPALLLPDLCAFFPGGGVPVMSRLPAGSRELAEQAARGAGEGEVRGLILRGHGGVTWGGSPREALYAAEALEHWARVEYLARTGGLIPGEGSQC